jgi:hypothetical protein
LVSLQTDETAARNLQSGSAGYSFTSRYMGFSARPDGKKTKIHFLTVCSAIFRMEKPFSAIVVRTDQKSSVPVTSGKKIRPHN